MQAEKYFVSNGWAYRCLFSENENIGVGDVCVYHLRSQYNFNLPEEYKLIFVMAGRSYPMPHSHSTWTFNAEDKDSALEMAKKVIANPRQRRHSAAEFLYSQIRRSNSLLPEVGTAAWAQVNPGKY